MTAEQRYKVLVESFLCRPDVAQEGKGFGASALKVRGRIFALLSSSNQLVVKLPAQRVQALVVSGDGERYRPGTGRTMKEWLALCPASSLDWDLLAGDALEFVAASR